MENILVLCDDLWHPAEVIEKGLAARKDERFCFDIVKAAKDIITPERIAKYRLIICCKGNSVIAANTAPWFEEGVTEVMPRDFEAYIQNGGGMLVVHSGLSFNEKDQPDYTALVGAGFVNHPPRCTVDLHIEQPDHPITEGVKDFTIRDEHYELKMCCDDYDVFMTSSSEKGGTQNAGYTRVIGDGRLCAISPGHTLDVWENPSFIRLITNAMEWCMGER